MFLYDLCLKHLAKANLVKRKFCDIHVKVQRKILKRNKLHIS